MIHQPEWRRRLVDEVREASRAFKTDADWPDAWLYLGHEPNCADNDWYDWDEGLFGLPVYHCPAWLTHSGHDGEHQHILPLWHGNVSDKSGVIREFCARLAASGDY